MLELDLDVRKRACREDSCVYLLIASWAGSWTSKGRIVTKIKAAIMRIGVTAFLAASFEFGMAASVAASPAAYTDSAITVSANSERNGQCMFPFNKYCNPA
jgi:hypothetical protein